MGASTGGFTDCLLQRGAREVIAVDVGYGTLDYRLRSDPRVAGDGAHERPRAYTSDAAGGASGARLAAGPRDRRRVVHLARKVLGAVLGCLGDRYDVLALVKPQFESAAGAWAKAGLCATRRTGARR